MSITISIQEDWNGVLWDKYALDENNKPLSFSTVRESVNFLADRNWTIEDLRDLDFNMEERA